ncbi:MAG: N-acetyl sugar amidotransferase [Synergistaceae bacterium]|jgi:N-acetyl sugar amidotransferase|nr:N-acetyl sugar amidotransferase [Synergistaceae bacterium]
MASPPPPNQLEAKYGLPEEVKFCVECVMTNQRPTSCFEFKHTAQSVKSSLNIRDDGVCDACHSIKLKEADIDWKERERELIALCGKFRRGDGQYDCLVPGSGGKDSFYAAHMLKYKYGMHPLTVTWAPNMYTSWGWRNLQSWIGAGFDNYLCTPNALTHRLLTRLAVENIFHPFQTFILGQKQLAPKLAVRFGIPLVFYGENEAEYGNPLADNKSAQRDLNYFSTSKKEDIYLGGVSLRDLEDDFGVPTSDLSIYLPSETSDFIAHGIQVHYLGYYLKWHPQGAYYYSVEHGGLEPSPERTPGTYSKYNSIDDKIDDHHYYTTYIKYGIGRCTYDASQEIRNREITRDEAVLLTKKFDGEYPLRFEKEIFEYLSLPEKQFPIASKMFEQPVMDREYFLHLADRFRSPHIWRRVGGLWRLRHTPYSGESDVQYGAPPKAADVMACTARREEKHSFIGAARDV